jgi:hypothetical protein
MNKLASMSDVTIMASEVAWQPDLSGQLRSAAPQQANPMQQQIYL